MTNVKVKIAGIGNDGMQEFEILSREKLEELIDELSEAEIYQKTYKEAKDWQLSGNAYTYIDARNGKVVTTWIQQNNYLHPWDNFYEIILCNIGTPTPDILLEDLIDITDDKEYKEFVQYADETGNKIEDFIIEKYGEEELQERIENIIEYYSLEFSFDFDEIRDQLDELYNKQAGI